MTDNIKAISDSDLAALERALQALGDKYTLAVRVCEEASTLAHNLGWDEDRYICQALETWRKGAL